MHDSAEPSRAAITVNLGIEGFDLADLPPGEVVFIASKQRVKAYWQFILCIAADAYRTLPLNQLTREHAKSLWCVRCKEELPIVKRKSVAGPHMAKYHPEELKAFQDSQLRLSALEVSRELADIFESADSSVQQRFEMLLAEWISADVRPVSIINDRGLIRVIEFVNSVSQKLTVPSRQKVTTCVHTNAARFRASLRVRLEDPEECEFYSASADIWTSMNCESFISLTIHYVTNQFEIQSWTLEVTSIPGRHDGGAIASVLSRSFSWWKVDPLKCVLFLRDGASNMVSACSKLGVQHMSCVAHSLHLVVGAALMQKTEEREKTVDGHPIINEESVVGGIVNNESVITLPLGLSIANTRVDNQSEYQESGFGSESDEADDEPEEWISDADIDTLCGEIFNFVEEAETEADADLGVADMEVVRQSVRCFRKLAEYFRRSQKGRSRLHDLQSERRKPLKVIMDSPTRWNSTMAMLQRFVELRSIVKKFFIYLKTPPGMVEFNDVSTKHLTRPTAEQWFTIQCLVELLAPFSVATKTLDGETYPTLISLYPVISSLKMMLSNSLMFEQIYAGVENEPFAQRVLFTMHSVRRGFLKLLKKRFDTVIAGDILWISLLDPYMTNSNLYTDDEHARAKRGMLNAMFEMKKIVGRHAPLDRPDFQSPVQVAQNPEEQAHMHMLRLRYASRMRNPRRSVSDDQMKQECTWEFSDYMKVSGGAKIRKNQKKPPSPLEWWKENYSKFPTLAPLARKWLGCIATSVPSERAFSTAGNTVTKRRSTLKADTVRDIVFMAQNVSLY